MKRAGLALLALSLAASAAPPADFDSLVSAASSLEQKQDYAGAARALEKALAARPDEYAVRIQLARDYLQLGRMAKARREFEKARAINPQEHRGYILEGYADVFAGKPRQAEKDLAALIAEDPKSPEGYHHMAAILVQQGRFADALPYVRLALDRLRADPRASVDDKRHSQYFLAEVLLQLSRWTEAEAAARTGLELSQGAPSFHSLFLVSLAQALGPLGRKKQASDALEEAAAECRPAKACPAAQRLQVLLPLIHFLAKAADKPGVESAADEALTAARDTPPILEMTPFEVELLHGIGLELQAFGEPGRAEAAYEAALQPALDTALAKEEREKVRKARRDLAKSLSRAR